MCLHHRGWEVMRVGLHLCGDGQSCPLRWLHHLMVSLTNARIFSLAGLSPLSQELREPFHLRTLLHQGPDTALLLSAPCRHQAEGQGWLDSLSGQTQWHLLSRLCSPHHAPLTPRFSGERSPGSSCPVCTSLSAAIRTGTGSSLHGDSRPHPSRLARRWQVCVLFTEQGDGTALGTGCAAPGALLPLPDRGLATASPVLASPRRSASATFPPASFLALSHRD